MPAWVPPHGETAGFAKVNNSRAINAGLSFRPIADTAKATLDWFQTQPEARRKKLRSGLAAEREATVLAAWKARVGTK
jgi:2'-hydroxyisoflavone reductase